MIFQMHPSEVPADRFEIYRFAGFPPKVLPPQNICNLAEECMNQLRPCLRPNLVYETFQKSDLEPIISRSKNLSANLEGCTRVVMFAATIGAQVDSVIRATQKIDAAKSGILQATGAMFIESFVDVFNKMISSQNSGNTKPRFSPGFGDAPLDLQKHFFNLLPCSKIGLSLMDTLIMAPEKSVTAFIGIL